ncbi:MAG: TOBE domain-containing protein [Lachnospiraceae bacterium]|jgi:molybdate transport system regulatory protein|nr:TOBE domain-containing protein [Lachnospiraceae bacterium]MCI1657966.1 TOBE domain-containing protein [Lachnospiraceae bacterium]
MISARNQLTGTVASIEKGAVNAIVKLDVPGGIGITSTISLEAVQDLGLAPGREATAIIKATSVMIGA